MVWAENPERFANSPIFMKAFFVTTHSRLGLRAHSKSTGKMQAGDAAALIARAEVAAMA